MMESTARHVLWGYGNDHTPESMVRLEARTVRFRLRAYPCLVNGTFLESHCLRLASGP